MHVFTFRKSTAGRKEKAKAVIRQKGKWFLNRIQITLQDPRSAPARGPPVPTALVISVFAVPTVWPIYLYLQQRGGANERKPSSWVLA